MSHHHNCRCHLGEQVKKFKAGKLGLLGGFLIVGHLLFHVAECLILPVIIAGFTHHDAEAAMELNALESAESSFSVDFSQLNNLRSNFFQTLEDESLLNR